MELTDTSYISITNSFLYNKIVNPALTILFFLINIIHKTLRRAINQKRICLKTVEITHHAIKKNITYGVTVGDALSAYSEKHFILRT